MNGAYRRRLDVVQACVEAKERSDHTRCTMQAKRQDAMGVAGHGRDLIADLVLCDHVVGVGDLQSRGMLQAQAPDRVLDGPLFADPDPIAPWPIVVEEANAFVGREERQGFGSGRAWQHRSPTTAIDSPETGARAKG